MASARVNIVWFRQDLRISDNPALAHAAGVFGFSLAIRNRLSYNYPKPMLDLKATRQRALDAFKIIRQ